MIQTQVQLPFSVAVGVVLQGIRIRLGRSLVTIMGVVLGIAFLVASLTGQALKRGVREEDRIRAEVVRMQRFLVAETGPLRGRVVGVVLTAAPNEYETRLLTQFAKDGLAQITCWRAAEVGLPKRWTALPLREAPLREVGRDASAVMLMGAAAPAGVAWEEVLCGARQRVLGLTRAAEAPAADATVVRLARALRPEEQTRLALEQKQQRFRNAWIIIISLLVTVMGISNAMLMSVTERFRDIGTMKCLGALSAFIRQMFLIESALMGISGGLAGCVAGVSFSLAAYAITYGGELTLFSLRGTYPLVLLYVGVALLTGVALSVVAAIYPAAVAARMVPANALRSTV